MNSGEQFPNQKQSQSDQHDADDHSDHDGQYVHLLRTIFGALSGHNERGSVLFVVVLEPETAIVFVVDELAQRFTLRLVHFQFVRLNRHESTVGLICFVQRARIVAQAGRQRAGLEHLTAHTVTILLTLCQTRWTVFAPRAGIVVGRVGVTLADAAFARTAPGAHFGIALFHARIGARRTAAVLARVRRLAHTAAALAMTMILAGTQLTVFARTIPIVAFAKLATITSQTETVRKLVTALARSASTLAVSGTEASIVRMAFASFFFDRRIRIFCIAFAISTISIAVAFANAASVRTGSTTLGCSQHRSLFALAVAQHLQIDNQLVLQADRSNANRLTPIRRVRWTAQQFDFDVERHLSIDSQTGTRVGFDELPATDAFRVIFDAHVLGQRLAHVVFELNRRRDLGVLLLDQFHHVGRIVEQLPSRTTFYQWYQLFVHFQLAGRHRKNHIHRMLLNLIRGSM